MKSALPSAQIHPRWGAKFTRPYPKRLWPFSLSKKNRLRFLLKSGTMFEAYLEGEPAREAGTFLDE